MAELDEAIEAAMYVMYGDHPHAENYRADVQLGVTAASELIVAATRRQVAEELLATTVQVVWPDGPTSHKLAEVMDAAREHYAAIARGRGETDTKEQK